MTDTGCMSRCYRGRAHDCGMLATDGPSPRIVLACTVCGMVRIVDVDALAQGGSLDGMSSAEIRRLTRRGSGA